MSAAIDLARWRASLFAAPEAAGAAIGDAIGEACAERVDASGRPLTRAAVLVPVVLHDTGATLLLTRRTTHLRDHAGQISFPGGRIEADDAGPREAALREALEEVGLSPAQVEVIGYLPEYRTRTGFSITPVVGLVTPPLVLRADPFEVAEVFEVPLDFLFDPVNHQRHQAHWRGTLRQYHALPYGDYFIWGATAGMIMSLFGRLQQAAGAGGPGGAAGLPSGAGGGATE